MIRSLFRTDHTALLPYLTAGLPDVDSSPDLFAAMAGAGADGFEIGIPYSDPLMDGPVIQAASSAALAAGVDLDAALGVVEAVVKRTGVPTLAMTYANVVFRVGPDEFCARLAATGASGIIVPDMPVDESAPVREAAADHDLGLVLFVAPTSSDERIEKVAALDPVFIYGVAEMGVTGERRESGGLAPDMTRRIRAVTEVPVALGVGISTPEQAAAAGEIADGVIVGSAIVRRVLEAETPEAAARSVAQAVSSFRTAL